MIRWPAHLKVEGKTIPYHWACTAQALNSQSRFGGRGLWILPLTGELLLTDRLWEEEPLSPVMYPQWKTCPQASKAISNPTTTRYLVKSCAPEKGLVHRRDEREAESYHHVLQTRMTLSKNTF